MCFLWAFISENVLPKSKYPFHTNSEGRAKVHVCNDSNTAYMNTLKCSKWLINYQVANTKTVCLLKIHWLQPFQTLLLANYIKKAIFLLVFWLAILSERCEFFLLFQTFRWFTPLLILNANLREFSAQMCFLCCLVRILPKTRAT